MNKEEKNKLIKLFKDYVDNQETLSIDNINIMEILPSLLKLQNDKGLIYGRSWCKHGDFSCFFNLERKWDRIQNIMERAMVDGVDNVIHSENSSTPTETFVDTVADLALYSLMWVGYMRETHPEEWDKFIEFNQLDK